MKSLRDRTRELEAALRAAHAQVSPEPHPLLREDSRTKLGGIMGENEGEARVQDPEETTLHLGMGSLSIGEHNVVRYHGQTAGTEVSQILL